MSFRPNDAAPLILYAQCHYTECRCAECRGALFEYQPGPFHLFSLYIFINILHVSETEESTDPNGTAGFKIDINY